MMKILLAFSVVFAVACTEFKAKWLEEVKIALRECFAEDGGDMTEGEFKRLAYTGNSKAMCMLACANEKIGMFDGNEFDMEKVHPSVSDYVEFKGKEYTNDIRNEVQECFEEVNRSDADRCKKQFESALCILRAA